MKREDMQRADYFIDAGVCDDDQHLDDIIDTIKPTTVPLHKRAQRNVVMGLVVLGNVWPFVVYVAL